VLFNDFQPQLVLLVLIIHNQKFIMSSVVSKRFSRKLTLFRHSENVYCATELGLELGLGLGLLG